jgi:pyridoxamine 5'-phosphate oxidase
VAIYAAKYALGEGAAPAAIGPGYRIIPLSLEFWQERPFRLPDRIEFKRDRPGAPWNKTRLYP